MGAGEYNQRICLLRKSIQIGDYTDKEVWSEYRFTKAAVKHMGGNREEQNNEMFYTDQVQFIVRYYICNDLDDEDHILWQGREYRITNIYRNPLTTNREITITTELVNK